MMSQKRQIYILLVCCVMFILLSSHYKTTDKDGAKQNPARGVYYQSQDPDSRSPENVLKEKRLRFPSNETLFANNRVANNNRLFRKNDQAEKPANYVVNESVRKALNIIMNKVTDHTQDNRNHHIVSITEREGIDDMLTQRRLEAVDIQRTPANDLAVRRPQSLQQTNRKTSNDAKFTYPINEETLCSKRGSDVVLLIAVFCGVDEQVERQYIRTTWGKVAKTNPQIRILFIVGVPSDPKFNISQLTNESSFSHDIIQASYLDTYRNLTFKSFAAVQWINTYCRNAKYILKIDSDMRIDPEQLLRVLKTNKIPNKVICGYKMHDAIVVRDNGSKWYVPEKMYTPNRYPDYCQGPAYIVSRGIIQKMGRVPCPLDPFPVDDAYITGILREQLNIKITQGIIQFLHHYGETDVQLSNGRYIMDVNVILKDKS